jgi:site-specific recombinase XerD
MKVEPVDKEYLTEEELHLVQSKPIKFDRIDQVRDIFVFCCYTGLAYVDAHALKYDNIESDSDGNLRLKIRRQKTGQAAYIPLLPPAIAIIDKYRNHPECIRKDVVLPVLSNQKMNAYLKEVADLSGIKKNLTTHAARHTFATTVTLANNISMESVSKMLGHSDMTITKQYARILDRTISNEMGQLAKKLYS